MATYSDLTTGEQNEVLAKYQVNKVYDDASIKSMLANHLTWMMIDGALIDYPPDTVLKGTLEPPFLALESGEQENLILEYVGK